MGSTPRPIAAPPVTRSAEFWVLVGYAVVLGVFGALVALGLLSAIEFGSRWSLGTRPGWFGGHWWWVAVTGGAGVLVGLVRRVTRLPDAVPGLFDDLRAERVDPRLVPGTLAVSTLSLIGGASLGPEKVLATLGGGAGSWIAQRRRLEDEDVQVSSLAGSAGIFGGVFSSPVIVVMMILEIARPGGRRFSKTLVTGLVAGSVSFGIYFALAGAVFLGAYRVPPYRFEDWQLPAGIALGLFGALVTTLMAGCMGLTSRLFGWLRIPNLAKATIGGVLFGVIGVALPLTMFSGGDQLARVLDHAQGLGLGLCLPILLAKVLTYSVSQSSGFLGGPIFPSLFIGGTAGVVAHQAVPGIPLGLAFSCLLPAVLASVAAAPFAMVLMAEFLTRAGPLQTAPVLIAVVTAFIAVEGLKYIAASSGRAPSRPRGPRKVAAAVPRSD